jgi:multidrug efflux pump
VSGAGAESRNSIGIVLVTGMAISTIFTLLVVPSMYVLLAATHRHADDPEKATAGVSVKPAAA